MANPTHPSNTPTMNSIQTARHYQANLVPLPQTIPIVPGYLWDYPAQDIQTGLAALHHLFAAIYQAGVETPEKLIPPGVTRRQKGLTDPDFAAYLRLFFGLGIYGSPWEDNDPKALWVDSKELDDFCTRARIKPADAYFSALEKFGLVYLPAQPQQFSFPSEPHLLAALVVFARACQKLTKKDTNPPAEFLRMDFRLLQISRKKINFVPLDPEEAIRTLEDDEEAAFIRKMDAWARSAGYTAFVKCTGVHKSEYIATYRLAKPGRNLLGFNTEAGHLHMHVNFNQTDRILPYIAQMPRAFRALYFERCTCAECGGCADGPLKIELDGAPRRLCHFSYMNLPEVPSEHFEAIQFLLEAQDNILKGSRNQN